MFIPHPRTISKILGISKLEDLDRVKLKGSKVKALIHSLAKQAEFDEDFYLSTYKDVKTAIDTGAVSSAHEHYYTHGVLEGRLPTLQKFNSKSYFSTNIDLALSLGQNPKENEIVEHYIFHGFAEGREISDKGI